MKNLVLVFCAFALFAFSSCKKCLNCVKTIQECGYCNFGSSGNSATFCNDGSTPPYDVVRSSCNAGGGTWVTVSTASTLEEEVCGSSSSEAEDKATAFKSSGYICQ